MEGSSVNTMISSNKNELLRKLNQAVKPYNETKRLEQLKIGNEYKIMSGKITNTKYGARAVVTIIENNVSYDVFLPHKFSNIEPEILKQMVNIKLKYLGLKKLGSRNYHDFLFV